MRLFFIFFVVSFSLFSLPTKSLASVSLYLNIKNNDSADSSAKINIWGATSYNGHVGLLFEKDNYDKKVLLPHDKIVEAGYSTGEVMNLIERSLADENINLKIRLEMIQGQTAFNQPVFKIEFIVTRLSLE